MIRIGLAGQAWASAAIGAARARAKPATSARRTSCFKVFSTSCRTTGARAARSELAGAAAPFATVGEVGAHRGPGGLAVAVGDSVEDRAVLGVDPTQVDLALLGGRRRAGQL